MNRLIFKKAAVFIAAFTLIITSFSSVGCKSVPLERTFFAADTVCTVTVYAGENKEKALDSAVELCNSLAKKLNSRDESSPIGILNKTGELKNADPDVIAVIKKGIYYSELSGGSFDITVKPLSDLWDFKAERIPSDKEISAALKKISYKNIIIDGDTVILKEDAKLDLGGIAKGYIGQKIAENLVENQVTSATVNLGGNVTAIGNNGGDGFNIGIQKPFSEDIITSVNVRDYSVVTSGTYQRYFEKDGKSYHHLLDTKKGYPIENGLTSVTVIARDSTDADALSTVLFLMGKSEGLKLVNSLSETEAVFIDKDNNITLSKGLKTLNESIAFK